jgi:hypothetical protein
MHINHWCPNQELYIVEQHDQIFMIMVAGKNQISVERISRRLQGISL